jgi:hypothetical protein
MYQEFFSKSPLLALPLVALFLFAAVFLAACSRAVGARGRELARVVSRLPLDDDVAPRAGKLFRAEPPCRIAEMFAGEVRQRDHAAGPPPVSRPVTIDAERRRLASVAAGGESGAGPAPSFLGVVVPLPRAPGKRSARIAPSLRQSTNGGGHD